MIYGALAYPTHTPLGSPALPTPRPFGERASKGGASPLCGEAWKLPDSGRGREAYLCSGKPTAKADGHAHGGPVGPLFFLGALFHEFSSRFSGEVLGGSVSLGV